MHSIRFVVVFALVTSPLGAAEPNLRNLNIRGLQIGGTTSVTIDGDDFGKTPRLLLPFAAKSVLKPGGTDKQATFDVTLADDVMPGYHHLRIVTDDGVSLPTVIGVDRLPQRIVTAMTAEQPPIALHGVVNGSGTTEVKFVGKKGQAVLIEVEAHRLSGKLRPIVHLFTPKKLQLSWAWTTPALFGDARIDTTLPEDGIYTVAVHDAEYAAAAPSYFRLKIGQWSFADAVFPPVIAKGQAVNVELLGKSAASRLDVPPQPSSGTFPLALTKEPMWSGTRPFVQVSSHAEFMQQAASGKLQELPAGLVAVSGKLLKPYDEDRYQVAVVPGTKLKLEVYSERYGSPLDAALVVRNEKGDQLARGEDSPNSLDPVLEYTVPDKTTSIIVGVVDGQGRAGPRGVYRLVIQPQTPAAKEFKLTTSVQRLTLPADGRVVVPLFVERRGYQGKIDIAMNNPTAGAKLDGATIPDDAEGTLLTMQRTAALAPTVYTWRGRGLTGDDQPIHVKGHPLEQLQPWLATEIAVAPSSQKAADFQIDWDKLPSDAGIVPGMKVKLPVKATRVNPKTAVKLTLMTSQNPPLVNNQPDPNKTIRQEKPVELGEKAASGDITALVPVDLPSPVYDIAIQAELLTLDKKTVLATAYTPVRRMAVKLPLVVQLDGPNRIEAAVDAKKGATIALKGKVERREGLKGDVVLALTGLPPGAKADPVTLKADATAFTLNVLLPANLAAGEIKGLKLSASAVADPAQPALRVKSRDVEIVLNAKQVAGN